MDLLGRGIYLCWRLEEHADQMRREADYLIKSAREIRAEISEARAKGEKFKCVAEKREKCINEALGIDKTGKNWALKGRKA